MRWRGVVFAALMASACVASWTTDARAQTVVGKEVAKKLFDDGVELERKGEYAAALAKFDEAAKIIQTPGIRFHQGYVHEMQGRFATALESYEAALKLAREQGKTEVESATLARIEPLRPRVPQLAVRLLRPADVSDVKVQLDDKEVPQPLLDGKPFRLDPGDHVLFASAPGYRTFKRKLQAREGQSSTIDVELVRSVAGAAPAAEPGSPETEPPPEEPRRRSIVAPVLATTGAVALVTTGVVAFLMAGSAQSDAEASCATRVDCEDERTKVRTLDTVALAGFVGGVGLGVLSVVLWTSGPNSTAPSASITGRLVAGPGTAALQGVFW